MAAAAIGSMRGSKLSAKEAALLAGELQKPSWESRNEGIHERVSFEDSIWGFDLAGGSYYRTPLRVTAVKRDSRADKAGIRPGDKLLRINDIDTSTLTIQEAHEIIIESGIHIRLAVSAPDDIEDSYNCYQDPTEEMAEMERQRKAEEEAERWRRIQSKFKQTHWNLQWPWVSKRRIIYKESNCFMVPSKYEDRHRGKNPAFNSALKKEDKFELFGIQTDTPTAAEKQPVFPQPGKIDENLSNKEVSKKDSNNNDSVSDRYISNGLKEERNPMEVCNDDVADSAHRNSFTTAVSKNNGHDDTNAEELNEELNVENIKKVKQELAEEKENHETVENEEVDEDNEFDQWDPNDNEEQDEEDTEEEDMSEEHENKVIDDVLKEEVDDIESSILENEI